MTALIQTLNTWGQTFCHHALWMLVQSGILVAILWGLDIFLRRRIKASIRYAIWLLVLVKLILPVDFKLPSGIGYWVGRQTEKASVSSSIPLPQSSAPVIAAKETIHIPAAAVHAADAAPTDTTPVSYESIAPEVKLSVQGWLLLLWIIGIMILTGGFSWQMLTVRRIISRGNLAPEFLLELLRQSQSRLQMKSPVQVRLSEEISSPAVCGLFRPAILIPSNLIERLDKGQFEAVLLHELSHIQRGDLWLNTVQTFFQIFYFYNPFVRLANHFIRKTREQANDERVLVCMNGRRDTYSAALVEVAAAVIGRPVFAVRLIGVAEPKNHLHERITLMMRKSIPTNAKIGFAGILVLLLLGAVLLPMAAGPRALAAEIKVETEPIKSGIAPITQEQFLTGSRNVLQQILDGYSRADSAAIAAPYTQDAMLLETENNMAIGKGTINAYYADSIAKGIRILSVDTVYHDIRVSGKYVFSIDKSIAKVRTPGMKQLVLAYVKFLTVWEIQPDSSLKIKVDSINYDKLPDSEPFEYPKGVSAVKDSFHCPQDNAQIADASKETLDKIRRLEKEFHAAFPANNIDTIASHYAADAILLPEQDDFITGRDQIKTHTEGNLRRFETESIGDQIICAEGTEEMVFVVNTYLIKMKDKTQNNLELSIPCKGVHIWQKQSDGSWQILMDIFNPNNS